MTMSVQVWRVSPQGVVEAVAHPTNTLDSDLAYVVLSATQPRMLFAWVGESATVESKEAAQRYAAELTEKMPEVAASLFHVEGSESEGFLAAMDTLPDHVEAEETAAIAEAAAVQSPGSQSPASKASKKREKKKKLQAARIAAAADAATATDGDAATATDGDAATATDGDAAQLITADDPPQAAADDATLKAAPLKNNGSSPEPTRKTVHTGGEEPALEKPDAAGHAGTDSAAGEELAAAVPAALEKTSESESQQAATEETAQEAGAGPAFELENKTDADAAPKPSSNPVPAPVTVATEEAKPSTAATALAALQAAQTAVSASARPSASTGSSKANYLADSAKAWGALPAASAAAPTPSSASVLPEDRLIEYDELKGLRAESGIDMTRKEDYLPAADFVKVFGKTREEFAAMPSWRRLAAKRNVGLF